VHRAALRLIALIVLLSGAADYFAFDVGDPVAPMNAAGTSNLICSRTSGASASYRMSPTTIGQTDTQDDGCIGCAAGFTAHRVDFRIAEVIAAANNLSVFHPSDPQLVRVDPPPRA
jgi:hypothetical protein